MAPHSNRRSISPIKYSALLDAADRLLAGLWRNLVADMQHAAMMQALGACPDERTLVLLDGMRDRVGTAAHEGPNRQLSTCIDDRVRVSRERQLVRQD